MTNDIKIKFQKTNENMKVSVFATITFKGIKIPGFKIVESKYSDELIIYLPSKKAGKNKYIETVKLSNEDRNFVTEEIKEEYEKFKLDKKTDKVKREVKKKIFFVTSIRLNLLFHFYRHHKKEITEVRLWFIARNILDVKRGGYVNIKELSKSANIKTAYLKKICRRSNLFGGMDKCRVYYKSQNKLMRMHKLYISKGKIRQEKITKKFSRMFKSKKAFESYISKCYMENDLNKKYKYKITKGRISYQIMADYFGISRGTAISNIGISDAKYSPNIVSYPTYRFKSKKEFSNWLLRNIDRIIDNHRVGDNLNSYYLRKIDRNNYCLTQTLPNIHKFTGFLLVNAMTHKGK